LFNANVLHNIRYGRLDATDEEVKEAAKKANVHAAIERLPDGYATNVGERGLMVSGGEKQRLAVARVMLKDPKILFFDEAVRNLSFIGSFLPHANPFFPLRLRPSIHIRNQSL
jgi:ATP-binding cassette, subfamily B (MDR/TAP), member 7